MKKRLFVPAVPLLLPALLITGCGRREAEEANAPEEVRTGEFRSCYSFPSGTELTGLLPSDGLLLVSGQGETGARAALLSLPEEGEPEKLRDIPLEDLPYERSRLYAMARQEDAFLLLLGEDKTGPGVLSFAGAYTLLRLDLRGEPLDSAGLILFFDKKAWETLNKSPRTSGRRFIQRFPKIQ